MRVFQRGFWPGEKRMTGKKVGLYTRVSTHDQQTLPLQLKELRRYAKQRGWRVVLQIQEVGSGVKERPQRETLLKAARRRGTKLGRPPARSAG